MKIETFIFYLVGYLYGKYEDKIILFIKSKVFKKW